MRQYVMLRLYLSVKGLPVENQACIWIALLWTEGHQQVKIPNHTKEACELLHKA